MKNDNKILENDLIEMIKSIPEQEAPEGLGFEIMGRIRETDKSFVDKVKDLLGYQMTITLTPFKAVCATALILLGFIFIQNRSIDGIKPGVKSLAQTEVSNSDLSNYFMGRGLLAKGEFEQSINYLKQAVALNPSETEYQFWLGVNYGALNDFENEKKSYNKALSNNPEHLMANYYLGHNYMSQKKWDMALHSYDRVLSLNNEFEQARFNKGLALEKLEQKQNAINVWKEYLSLNQVGSRALKAANYLNASGDFSYRIHQIGKRKIVLGPAFKTEESNVLQISSEDLNKVASIVDQSPDMVLHVIVYSNENIEMAKKSAIDLKSSLVNSNLGIDQNRIRISWFGQGETLQYRGISFLLDESIRFIGILKENIDKGVST